MRFRTTTAAVATALAIALTSLAALAADFPAPKEGTWTARDFKFHTGEVMPELKLAYTTIGEPGGEPVLVLHGTTGSATSMLGPNMGGELFGKGQPLDTCFELRDGSDVTLVAWGAMLSEAPAASDGLAGEGISAEVIDVATLKPLDATAILRSVEKTGRCVIVHEAPLTGGFGGEIAAHEQRRAGDTLQAFFQVEARHDLIVNGSRDGADVERINLVSLTLNHGFVGVRLD